MILEHTFATATLDTIVAFDTIVALDIPLVALLTSPPVMWRKEHLWNFSVLQRVHLFNLFLEHPSKQERTDFENVLIHYDEECNC
jgi:hypothetical protein